jgi:ribosomal protein L15
MISKKRIKAVKLLGKGELTKKINISIDKASASAVSAVEKA